MSHVCVDCGTSLADRHRLAERCFCCSSERGRQRRPDDFRVAEFLIADKVAHDRDKAFAQLYISKLVKFGFLEKASTLLCVDCGRPAHVYDHRSYLKPEAVDPVCRSCNAIRGPALSSGSIPARPKADPDHSPAA